MKPVKSYVHACDPDNSTYYRQRIKIDQEIFDRLRDCLQAELCMRDQDHYYQLYLSRPLKHVGNIVFLNLTQRDFFNRFLKLKLSDLNTYLLIN